MSEVNQSVSNAKLKPSSVNSATLARLIEEVRNNSFEASGRAYDRVHNRHNR